MIHMATRTRWDNLDLIIKPVIATGASTAKADPYTRYFQSVYVALGGPPVKTGGGALKPLTVDGQPGPQTRNAAIAYMKANGLTTTGQLDQQLWYYLDWQAYNLFGDRWKPCGLTVTSMGNGGPAISKGHNGIIVSPLVRVNIRGLALEGQRYCDVRSAFLGEALGQGRAVLRFARGTSIWSWHGKTWAGDEMGDEDGDKVIEEHEKRLMRALFDYLVQRANLVGPAIAAKYTEKRPDDLTRTQVQTVTRRGVDLMSTIVCGNLRYADGKKMWPEFRLNRDVSWSAGRNSTKDSDRKVHVSPFHLHANGWIGAPVANPFKKP